MEFTLAVARTDGRRMIVTVTGANDRFAPVTLAW
jgi:hypothetical protein